VRGPAGAAVLRLGRIPGPCCGSRSDRRGSVAAGCSTPQFARVPVPAPRLVGSYQVAQYPPPPPLPPPVQVVQPQFAPAVLPELPYTLGSGDRLRIVVFGQEGLTNLYAVDANGNITMPLIGLVPAQGATTYQLAGAISARLQGLHPRAQRGG